MSLKGKSSYCREQVLFGAPCEQRTEPNSSSLARSEGSRGSMYQSKLTVMASNRLCKVESMLWRAPTAQPSWDLCRPQLGTRILTVMVLCLSVLFLKPDMHLSRYRVCSVIAPNSEVIFVWFTFHFWTGEHQLVKAFIWKQSLSALPLCFLTMSFDQTSQELSLELLVTVGWSNCESRLYLMTHGKQVQI